MIPLLADIFDKIDPQVIFVIVVLVIGAVQSVIERFRKARAERELNEDLARRAEERSATLEPTEYEPPLDEVYEEHRREILERQRRMIEEIEEFGEPESTPPPLPPSSATPPPLAPVPSSPASAPPSPSPSPSPALVLGQPQAPTQPEIHLTPEEQAALAAFQARSQAKRKPRHQRVGIPARRLLSSPSDLRTAFILKEILGSPKGLQ